MLTAVQADIGYAANEEGVVWSIWIEFLHLVKLSELLLAIKKLVHFSFDLVVWRRRRQSTRKFSQIVQASANSSLS